MPPRDNQKSKVYKAEGVVSKFKSRHAEKLLTTKVAYQFGTKVDRVMIEQAQAYVDDLVSQRWFQSRWGRRKIEVRLKVYGSATGYHGGHICLPPWARNERVILHEVAHTLLTSRYAPHGPEFAATYLTLVENRCGKDAAAALREAYKANRVKYRNGLAVVPKAGTEVAVTKTIIQRFERRQAAAKQVVLTGATHRLEAAAVIRAAVKAGRFGPSGRKPRTHALEVARLLEKHIP